MTLSRKRFPGSWKCKNGLLLLTRRPRKLPILFFHLQLPGNQLAASPDALEQRKKKRKKDEECMFSITVNVTQLRWFRNLKRAPNAKVFVILILTKMIAMFHHNETTPTRMTVINDNGDVFHTLKCHMSNTPTYWIRCVWNTLQLRSSLSIRLCYSDGLHSDHTSWRRPREQMYWNTCSMLR